MYSQNRPLDALNTYLVSRDVSPWEKTSGRTKRYYTRKASQGVAALVQGYDRRLVPRTVFFRRAAPPAL